MNDTTTKRTGTLDRREVIKAILDKRGDALVVTGLGSSCYDAGVYDHPNTFYLWGAMGAAAMMGLGLALAQPKRRVIVITGDGEALMGLGAFATIGAHKPANLSIVVMDNELYAETGMQPTHTARGVSLSGIAKASGFTYAETAWTQDELERGVEAIYGAASPVLLDIKVSNKRYPMSIRMRDGAHIKNRFRENLLGSKAFDWYVIPARGGNPGKTLKRETPRTPTRELIEFLAALTSDRIPASAIDSAKWCLLDTLGCMLFGAPEPWSQIMAAEMLEEGSKGGSTVVGQSRTVAAPAAALCNGTAAHGFELDDHLDEAIVHPGAIIVSAALATAEAVNASGARLLLGIVAGYEMANRLGLAMGVKPSQHGWHKTAVAGPIGASVAASVIMGLCADRIQNAVGLACATASGTKAFAAGEGGGMEKRMHAGRAAEAGVRMAQLAARGFTSPPGAVAGRFGLLHVMSGDAARPELLSADLGERWAVEHVYVKLYPCCAWIQAAAQELVGLRGPRPLAPEDVRKVQVGVSAYAGAQNGNPLPQDTMGAQFSIQYCAALALTGDPADPAMYAPEAIAHAGRRALAQRVEIVVDPEMEAAYPRHYGGRVVLELANGEVKTAARLDPHGMPADPCTEAELTEKFERLASRVKSREAIADIMRRARGIEKLTNVSELAALLRP